MKYPPHLLDDIRARITVSDVVGRRVKLRRQGREWAGLSPFNPEKTPSFFVNDHKGFYHCFSSGRHGDIFRFLMETEGVTFPEAVERLASEAGVILPKPDVREEKRERERASLGEVVEMAASFFEWCYRQQGASHARAYADRRGLRPDIQKSFRIGYAPAERDALKKALMAKGMDEASLIEAGLLIKPDDGRPSYDRFRNRLMIPIEDERGRVVAFGGRALNPDDNPKYLNSPETPLFHKGLMLFNAHRARAAAHEQGTVIVVEGYMDAIAVYQAGIGAVVATLGTAFTEDQIQRLWKFAEEPVVCFDGDKAGIRAAHRALDRILPLLKSGYSFNFAFLPDGKDPDELIGTGGKEAFLFEMQRAVPLADVLWDREVKVAPIDTPERKASLEKRLEDLTELIPDPRVKRAYQLKFRLKLSSLFWKSEKQEQKAAQASQIALPKSEGDLAGVERIVLGLAVEYPDLFERALERIITLDFGIEANEAFKRELYRIAVDSLERAVTSFYESVDPRFYFILEEVHGGEKSDAEGRIVSARGHRLAERFPILKFHPPETYVEKCLWHFLDRIELKQMERDLSREVAELTADAGPDIEDRILTLSREIARRKEEYHRREQELAEDAKSIRAIFGGARPMPTALPKQAAKPALPAPQ